MTKLYWNQRENMFVNDGVVFRRWLGPRGVTEKSQLMVPKTLRNEVMQAGHENPLQGHFATDRTARKIKEGYYWYHLVP